MAERVYPQEPTADQCTRKAPLGGAWFAMWYPSMGGYVGKAAVWIGDLTIGCVEVLVWHDGEFPFDGSALDGWTGQPRIPVSLHHCDVGQFRTFAADVEVLQQQASAEDPKTAVVGEGGREVSETPLAPLTVPQMADFLRHSCMHWENRTPAQHCAQVGEGPCGYCAAADLLEAQAQRADEYKALANVGTWHNDCRLNRQQAARELLKSQAIIDKMADAVSALTAERDKALAEICLWCEMNQATRLKAEAERDELRARLAEAERLVPPKEMP